MGTYLDNPVTEKVSEDMENDTLVCGVSSMQGWRVRQEVILYNTAQYLYIRINYYILFEY